MNRKRQGADIAFESIYFVCSTNVVDPDVRTAASRRLDEEDGHSDPEEEAGRTGSRDYFRTGISQQSTGPRCFSPSIVVRKAAFT